MELESMHASIAFELMRVEATIRERLSALCRDDEVLEGVFRTFSRVRGKYLRPRLVLLSAFAVRGGELRSRDFEKEYHSLIKVSAVCELVHCASLVHDDVLDEAPMRRGQASMNARLGNKTAILAGDILYSQAFEMLLESSGPEIGRALTRCVHRMCRAEITNLSAHDFAGYEAIIAGKTASLMRFCCMAGVQAVGLDKDGAGMRGALERFGYSFGMLYQLADDLCDGDSEVAVAGRARVIELMVLHVREAEAALGVLPDTAYRDSLQRMVRYVVIGTGLFPGAEGDWDELGAAFSEANTKG